MLTIYTSETTKLLAQNTPDPAAPGVVWIDMLAPTLEEEALVEKALGIDVPTREEVQGIELSNRLYKEDDALFMTANLIVGSESAEPRSVPVTFILVGNRLVTVRYEKPRAFEIFQGRAMKALDDCASGRAVLADLLETIVGRLSDPLEDITLQIDALSREVFQAEADKKPDYAALLKTIGRHGDLNSKAKEALVGLDRILSFMFYHIDSAGKPGKHLTSQLKSIEQDIHALTDYAGFLSGKINFLLEAALGMITIEQNTIIKFFSVAAVIFLPPTLIASIYGMNFTHMPELEWVFAYPATIAVMLLSAIVPYLYFKHRKWL